MDEEGEMDELHGLRLELKLNRTNGSGGVLCD